MDTSPLLSLAFRFGTSEGNEREKRRLHPTEMKTGQRVPENSLA